MTGARRSSPAFNDRAVATASDPAVLVLAVPYLYATVIAEQVEAVGLGPVVVPNLDDDEWLPAGRYRAVIASVPTPKVWGDITVELPLSFLDPVLVTVDDITVPVLVSHDHPLHDVAKLLTAHVRPNAPIDLDDTAGSTSPR